MSDFKVGDLVFVSDEGKPWNFAGLGEVTSRSSSYRSAFVRAICSTGAEGWEGSVPFIEGRLTLIPPPPEQKPDPVFDFGARKRYVDPETGYEKDTSAYRFDLVPADALAELAKVYGTGEVKYPSGPEGPNWLSGGPLWPSRAALGRHLASYDLGQDVDPSDECYELAKVAWHAFGLLVYHLRGIGNDTRGRLKLINEGEVSQ